MSAQETQPRETQSEAIKVVETFTTTNYPAIANAPLPAEGSSAFHNSHYAAACVIVPWIVQRFLPFGRSWTVYFIIGAILFLPVTMAYWVLTSKYGPRINEKVPLPNKPLDTYYTIKDAKLKEKYGDKKMPMQVFHDAFFDGKIEFNGDVLDVMEYRHDWTSFQFTPELFRYVLFNLIPDVLIHSQNQDEEQVRDHYDRGNDFYAWFLGPRMIYTSGIISDINRMETLEELQDNKLNMVCEKLALKPGDKLLDIGCGWGTLVTHAAKNYGADVTGVTLSRNQTEFGTQRLRENGVPESQGRILCCDYREIPKAKGYFNKVSCLEMAEHVGIIRYGGFLRNVRDIMADDGILVFQVAGVRKQWQFEDLVWGLFMNKYIFPGADASKNLGWVIQELEGAGFEVKSVDVIGVHYSATLHRWYLNWVSNKDAVIAKYGPRWYRIWVYFLAYSTIQGSFSCFQITLTKNLNAVHRIEGVPSHAACVSQTHPEFKPVESHKELWPKTYAA